MGRLKVYTGCRDCALCTGHAFTGTGRKAARGTAAVATLGISAALTKKCKICSHPMSEHASSRSNTPAGWYPVVGAEAGVRRWWDGESWGVLEADFIAQQEVEQQALAAAGAPPAGWMQDPDDASMLRWWDGSAWGDFRKPTAT